MLQNPVNVPVPIENQLKILVALTTALIYHATTKGRQQELLLQLAAERHKKEDHTDPFVCCQDPMCKEIVGLDTLNEVKEVTFRIEDLDRLREYRLRYGSRLLGTVTAWIEKEAPLIQVAQ